MIDVQKFMALVEENRITDLATIAADLPEPAGSVFPRLYSVRTSEAIMVYPSVAARNHIAAIFRTAPDQLQTRRSIRVTSRVLEGDETLFNPNRAGRPIQSTASNRIEELKKNNPPENCDFCLPEDRTPADPFDRVRGKYSITAANAASYDALHSLVIPTATHHPLDLTEEVLTDMIHTGNEWFKVAHEYSPDARFPFMMMNLLPRGGSSIYHPHSQVLLTEGKPYGEIERIRQETADYQNMHGYPFLDELAFALRPMGLVADVGSAHIVFNLAPKKEKEVFVYDNSGSGLPNGDLSKAVFSVIRWWREDLRATSFNMAIYMPPLGENLTEGPWKNFFPFVRLVERGPESNLTSDFGAMETYGTSVVSADPFALARSYKDFYDLSRKSRVDKLAFAI